MNTAQIIIKAIPMRDAAIHFGYRPNWAGYIKCPFHHEKTASLKLYPGTRGWHCFGCGAGGSVIDFVERLYGTDFKGAVRLLNTEFSLCLPAGNTYRDREKLRRKTQALRKDLEQKEEDQRSKEEEYDKLISEYVRLDMIRQGLKPESPADGLCDAYVYAMHRIPVIEYLLDSWG